MKQSEAIKKLDSVFSKYIRLRDAMPNGTFRCISCGKILPIQTADAGHFFSRMHMNTRFDEDNVHAECRQCNRMTPGHLIGYMANLEKKIGTLRMEALEQNARRMRKWSVLELQCLIDYYSNKCRELQKEKGLTI